MLGHYLMFNGNCAEALEVYASAFGGKIMEMRRYGDMPPNPDFPVPEDKKNLVLNSRLQIDGQELMGADSSERGEAGSNMYVSVVLDEKAVQKAWDGLKQDAEIYMELTPTFFASLHGSLRDRFGINWMFTAMN